MKSDQLLQFSSLFLKLWRGGMLHWCLTAAAKRLMGGSCIFCCLAEAQQHHSKQDSIHCWLTETQTGCAQPGMSAVQSNTYSCRQTLICAINSSSVQKEGWRFTNNCSCRWNLVSSTVAIFPSPPQGMLKLPLAGKANAKTARYTTQEFLMHVWTNMNCIWTPVLVCPPPRSRGISKCCMLATQHTEALKPCSDGCRWLQHGSWK